MRRLWSQIRKVTVVTIIVTALGCASDGSGGTEVIGHYPEDQWRDAGAQASYHWLPRGVTIAKHQLTPAWGGAILELGEIDPADDYYLSFEVAALRGFYAVSVHYGGAQRYERQSIKVQEDTAMRGKQVYNLGEAMRMEGVLGRQPVAIQILVVDPPDAPGTAMIRLKDLRVGS